VRTDRRGVARFNLLPSRIGLVAFASGGRALARPSCATVLAVQLVKGTRVTG
jgi:hypothetical protein